MIVAKNALLDILEWTAENVVADIVKTINHVTMSVECVLVVVRTGILRTIVIALVTPVNMAKTVLCNVLLIAMEHVNTKMDRVNTVRPVGKVTTAAKNVYSRLAITANINAVNIVSTSHVTDLTEAVYMVVWKIEHVH